MNRVDAAMSRFFWLAAMAALAGILAGGCGPGSPVTPASSGDLSSPTEAPRPTEVPGPPALALRSADTGGMPGELGSFLWDGLGSDAPWVVPSAGSRVAGGALLEVAVTPPIGSVHWTARWAPVTGGVPGNPTAAAEGGVGDIRLTAPGRPGAWGLALEVSFGDGRRGTWYWRLDVDP